MLVTGKTEWSQQPPSTQQLLYVLLKLGMTVSQAQLKIEIFRKI